MSRIQFNLLPDVKLQYIRANRSKNLVLTICVIASAVSVLILLILLGTVEIVQKQELKKSQADLSSANSQLSNVSDLNKIVTVQNQLNSLVTLQRNKHATERILDYVKQLTPTQASINRLNLNLGQNTLIIAGSADSQKTVNVFVDTLKFTTYKIGDNDSAHQAFTNVIENTFSINANGVDYELDMNFDPNLFSNNMVDSQGRPQTPKLSVPTLTTTRSVIDDPSNALFQKKSSTQGGQ